jgi:hypothetical protein
MTQWIIILSLVKKSGSAKTLVCTPILKVGMQLLHYSGTYEYVAFRFYWMVGNL